MITWSSIRILSVLAAVAADWVSLSSSVLGFLFPLGWLWERINDVASQRIASLSSTLISIRHVFTANAKRIGHGVDIAFEEQSILLLNEMKRRRIAVEINLSSNEFILGVKDDAHPFMLYRQAGVPTVLSTDDPSILRTSLTQQYVLATLRYGLSYPEI